MKKFYSFTYKLLLITLLSTLTLSNVVFAKTSPPIINAQGIVLLDATTGQVLYSKNPDTQFEPASTTKVLTGLIVLENAKLDEKVTVGKNPPFAEGSSIGLREGEVITVEELLLGLFLESGNDCAEALAEHISGTKEKFAELMNKRAKELGATNSCFKNPSGLHESGHVTTAHDLSLIMREAIKKPDYLRLSQTMTKQLDAAERWVNNGNLILNKNSKYYYKYSVAAKKGFTPEAKFTNVAVAKKDGQTLIASVLKHENQYDSFKDLGYLFDYGFENFTLSKIYSEGDEIETVSLPNEESLNLLIGTDVYYSVAKEKEATLQKSIKYNPVSIGSSTFKRGETITKAQVSIDGKEISTVDLVSSRDWQPTKSQVVSNVLKDNLVTIICIIIAILILFIFIRRNKIKRKRQQDFRRKLAQAKGIKRD